MRFKEKCLGVDPGLVANSILFSEINESEGYALPTAHFWELWNSEQRDLVVRLRFIPMPIGEELGAGCKWIVRLPTHVRDYVSYSPPSQTHSIGEIIGEALL